MRGGWRRGRWWLQCASYAYRCNYHRLHLLACVVGVGVGVRARSRACMGCPRRLWGRGGVCVPPMNALMFVVTRGGFLAVALAVNVVMYIGSVFGWCWCWCWWVARCCAVLFCVMSCCVVLRCVVLRVCACARVVRACVSGVGGGPCACAYVQSRRRPRARCGSTTAARASARAPRS